MKAIVMQFSLLLTSTNLWLNLGEDFEVAALISFLVSDDARFISTATIPIDGGYTAV